MISILFLSYIHDLLSELNNDFFVKSSTDKESILNNSSLTSNKEIKEYLIKTSSFNDFLKDVKEDLLLLNAEALFSNNKKPILSGYYEFLSLNVIPVLDKISVKFFVASKEDKMSLLKIIFNNNGIFFDNLKSFLLSASNEEEQEIFSIIAKKINKTISLIKIKSARECTPSLKTEIRNHFGENYFVIFQVNTRLLGGMLVYKDGKINDSSWIGKINALKTL